MFFVALISNDVNHTSTGTCLERYVFIGTTDQVHGFPSADDRDILPAVFSKPPEAVIWSLSVLKYPEPYTLTQTSVSSSHAFCTTKLNGCPEVTTRVRSLPSICFRSFSLEPNISLDAMAVFAVTNSRLKPATIPATTTHVFLIRVLSIELISLALKTHPLSFKNI